LSENAHHTDHGLAPSRVWACTISAVGFVIGAVGFPTHIWVLVGIGAALQIVAGITKLSLDAAGYGPPDAWGELKAKAKAERAAAAASSGS
jgi:uncharacterized membrane protein